MVSVYLIQILGELLLCFLLKRIVLPKWWGTTEVRSVYVVVFDKLGKTLSGWHYEKLREFDVEWIQQSVIRLNDEQAAEDFARTLREFGVQNIRILKAVDVTARVMDYGGT